MAETSLNPTRAAGAWRDLGRIVTAHVVMLRDEAVLDDQAAAALVLALDGVGRGEPPAVDSLAALVDAFDERLDALTPPGAGGAARVARAGEETVAALLRLAMRAGLLDLAAATAEAELALLDVAAAQVVTLMPAYGGGQASQPTTFGHVLGGLIGPLGRAGARIAQVYAEVNQSPLGALSLASTGLAISRQRTAALLGFDSVVANTYDAVAAVDHLAAGAEVVAAVAAPQRRFLAELLTWLRTEPTSFRLAEGWVGRDPSLPQLAPPTGLHRLAMLARRIEDDSVALTRLARETAYGPLGAAADPLDELAGRLLANGTHLARRTTDLAATGLEVNRAYLANRAGRGHTTSSDLADFLMIEEGLEPIIARNIAALTIRRAIEQGIEVSGITPQQIDAAAMFVLGRELAVEVEAMSRYLAPRRFIERRTATGSPSPTATRAYLDAERARLGTDVRWRDEAAARLAVAAAELDRLVGELAASRD